MADIHFPGYWTFNSADGVTKSFETRDEAIKALNESKDKSTTTSKLNIIKRKIIMVKNVNQDVLLLYSTDTDSYYFRNSQTTFISLQAYRTQDIALADFEAKKVIWVEETNNENR
jgi:soluble P-type ATPase